MPKTRELCTECKWPLRGNQVFCCSGKCRLARSKRLRARRARRKRKTPPAVTVSTQISRESLEWVRALAAHEGVSVAAFLRGLVRARLEELNVWLTPESVVEGEKDAPVHV